MIYSNTCTINASLIILSVSKEQCKYEKKTIEYEQNNNNLGSRVRNTSCYGHALGQVPASVAHNYSNVDSTIRLNSFHN